MATSMRFQYNDGGRLDAGFYGASGDCAVRAIAIVTQAPYIIAYQGIKPFCQRERKSKGKFTRSHPRTGIHGPTLRRYMASIGWDWTATMGIGTGCTVHMREDELPTGRILCRVSRHFIAVINGVMHDVAPCDREGLRCVYGYWHRSGAPGR